MSKTRAEIEAEIARLTARLDHVGFDPAFTPAELVRWDPSLVGTVLHLQHYEDIPANAFDTIYFKAIHTHTDENLDTACCSTTQCGPAMNDEKIRMEGVLTPTGLRFIKSARGKFYKFAVSNEFESMTKLPIPIGKQQGVSDTLPGKLSFKALGMTVERNEGGFFAGFILPLANPDRPLLDQIFVATSTRVHNVDIVVDKYPLSTLYNEWKRDKEAARGLPPQRRTELDVAKAQIAELQAQMRVLMADRAAEREADRAKEADLVKQNERLREALHVAVQTPNLKGFVQRLQPTE